MRPLHIAIALLVITIWGLNFVMVKLGLSEVPPFLFMALRYGVVALILIPFVKWPKGKFWPILAYSVILGNLHFSMMSNAVDQIDVSTVALLSQLNTPFAVILAAILLKDYPGWRRVLGIVIAFAGCAVIAGEPRLDDELWPVLLVVGGTFMFGLANIQVKAIGDIDPFALNAWMALMAAPQIIVWSLIMERDQLHLLASMSAVGWSAVFYQSVVVVIVGYGLWHWLLKRYPVSQIVPFTLLMPVIGVAGGVLLLGDPLTLAMIGGGALIIVGVSIVALRQAARGEAADAKSA
jgi:O-acetylserine/cysteine efflux transporter